MGAIGTRGASLKAHPDVNPQAEEELWQKHGIQWKAEGSLSGVSEDMQINKDKGNPRLLHPMCVTGDSNST